jgi:hypothetical protein
VKVSGDFRLVVTKDSVVTGWKYYLVLIIPAFIGAVVELIWWPETRRLPLEVRQNENGMVPAFAHTHLLLQEVAKLFGDPVAVELDAVHGDGFDMGEGQDEKRVEEKLEFV